MRNEREVLRDASTCAELNEHRDNTAAGGNLQLKPEWKPLVPPLRIFFLPFYLVLFSFTSCNAESGTVKIEVGEYALHVEIADTPELRTQGLMNRQNLPDNQGMLFIFEVESRPSFWMKDTGIPLDLAFISANGTIRQIENLKPFSLASVKSNRYVLYALEVNQGWFKKRGIIPGDTVDIPN